MKIQLNSTIVFEKNWEALQNGWRIIVNEGGTGSSKTYSLAQIFFLLLLQSKNKVLTIARKTMPALRATAMRDFFNILKENGAYNPDKHNKSENTYEINGNLLEFISVDEPLRVRSRRRDYLWMNETNEFSIEDWRQLSMRTSGVIFLDYNPSYLHHWIYEEVLSRKDCLVIRSTYRDNPFLPEKVKKEIEHLRDVDENYWRIYGLGLRGTSQSLIFPVFEFCEELPEGERIFGLDFGYNHPTALIEAVNRDEGWYLKERIYERFLTNTQLISKLKELQISRRSVIYCDAAEPQRIKELQDAGFNALPADKTPGSVKKGIDTMKSKKIYLTKDSVNLANELKRYSWKLGPDGKPIGDEPVPICDDAISAARYAIHTFTQIPKKIYYTPPVELGFGGVEPYF